MTTTLNKPPSSSPAKTERPHVVIQPTKGWMAINFRELWEYRDLIYYMTWRSITVRYKQTILGASWAILQPFMQMVVFSIFFGGLARIPSDGIPYPIFSFTALVPWSFFASGLSSAATSLVGSSSMLKKIYFPRLVIPLTAVLSSVVDFLLAFFVLLIMAIGYITLTPPPTGDVLAASVADIVHLNIPLMKAHQLALTPNIVFLAPLFLIAFVTTLGFGLWLSALNVQFRDVRHAVNYLVRLGLFITPVLYPSSLISPEWRLVYALNPMAGVIEGFRWALLGVGKAPSPMIAISVVVALLILISGLFYFRRVEKTFADVV